ncbi:DUF5719 family protein [Aeromicrobium massiliense]|uniref:DUF5719 family protein n=1 Tax=Aeromicrobium massiliense TaxID=1464554 RepID=UPI000578A439|nr:DUF5719 family protein [Aeromicrobium massiliense]
MTGRLRALLWPLVAAALVAAGVLLPEPDRTSSDGDDTLTVEARTLACAGGTRVAAGALAVHDGARREATVLPAGEPVEALSGATTWAEGTVSGPVSVRTTDERGAGAVAFTRSDEDGLELAACPWAAAASAPYLVGGGAAGDHQSTLQLTGTSGGSSVVDLRLWGAQGPVEGVGTTGIALEPGEARSVRLTDLAAGESELAVQVVVRSGQVAASLRDRAAEPASGREVVTPVATARRVQVVTGVVPGDRRLVLLNPTGTSTPVTIEALGPDGTFAPTGLEDLQARAGAVTAVPLPASLGDDVVSLRVRADVPLVATVRSAANGDVADAAPAPALDGPAVAPLAIGSWQRADLVLSAPGRAASVRLVARDAAGREVGTAAVEVAAGATAVTDLRRVGDGAAWVEVRPDGELHAAVAYRSGSGASTLTLAAAPVDVPAPDLRPAR